MAEYLKAVTPDLALVFQKVHGAQCAVYQRTSTEGRHENADYARAPDIA